MKNHTMKSHKKDAATIYKIVASGIKRKVAPVKIRTQLDQYLTAHCEHLDKLVRAHMPFRAHMP